uniref:Precursor to Protein Sir22 n=1 Tax=Streptococcus pyogenes TaxID=1314 RepID=UPI00080A7FC1|nr:Chain A, Precursor to Protein Sir22 [Streptococcus pyogenes]5HYT_C Chain C, Precursor to Protein Sir22 [Streptococcus pyogenes]5HYT_E Chain E, Precursor to Protein Sir22 [Streptococcus pyogenes]5HYT_G Chain G, Precursor to Protein Sir22 [Streptococcus pyogenes]
GPGSESSNISQESKLINTLTDENEKLREELQQYYALSDAKEEEPRYKALRGENQDLREKERKYQDKIKKLEEKEKNLEKKSED